MLAATKEWVELAENDFAAAEQLFTHSKRPVYEIVCYHCQQCIEKYLKALLVENDLEVERTHRLLHLLEQLSERYPELVLHREGLYVLTNYATDTRYPGEIPVSRNRASDAIQVTKDLRDFLQRILSVEP